MDARKLYTVAIFALQLDPEFQVTKIHENGIQTKQAECRNEPSSFNFNCAVLPGCEVATSKEEAQSFALTQAKQIWPESEGYVWHRAFADEIKEGLIIDAAARIEAGLLNKAETEESVM